MLAELLMSALASAGRIERRMGLVTASVGLWSRGGRRHRQWEPHHARCRAVALRAMEGLARRRTVLVLGSGLMKDVPAQAYSRAFQRVILVDAVHLPPVRLAMRRYSNVELVTCDLTGLAAWFAGRAGERSDPLARFVGDATIDLVVSANVLSQLPLGVEEFVEHAAARASGAGLPAGLPERSLAWHLADLARFSCPVCLLTDVRMEERTRDGTVTDELDLLRGERLSGAEETWTWTVAPFGEIDRRHEFVHTVCAWARWEPSRHWQQKSV